MAEIPVDHHSDRLRRARSGERSAFDHLVQEHMDAIRTLIALELGDGIRGRVEVDDILQETLLRAFRSAESFRGATPAEFRSWLAGIAHHTVIDRARRLSAQKSDYRREVPLVSPGNGNKEALDSSWPELHSLATSPSRILAREERLERFLAAIQSLSSDHRRVVVLSLLRCLPRAEVARQMNRSETAVGMLLVRAIRALREVFGDPSSLSLPRGFDPGEVPEGADR